MLNFLFLFVLSFAEASGLCSVSCIRQTSRPITTVVGPSLGERAIFSCKTPSKIYITGEAYECYARAGDFVVERRRKNEYACLKIIPVDPSGGIAVFYRKQYRPYLNRPTLCEVCSAPDKWEYNVAVEEGNLKALKRAMGLKQAAIGCTLPKNCPIRNPFTDFPCFGCEAPFDDGHCCAGCIERKWK